MPEGLTQEQKLRMQHSTEMARLIRAFKERFGEEAYQVVAQITGNKAFSEWQEVAGKSENNSIESLISLLWEPLRAQGFEYEVLKTDVGFQMKCTRCGFYELAKYCGITDEAFYMVCEADPYIAEGFNPKIGLKRTKTLMQGHDCCDHFYYYKDEAK
jgi:predicted ArsR family transcriptional regulator